MDVETQPEKLDLTPYFSRAPSYPPINCECSFHSELCGSPEPGSVSKFILASVKLGFVEHLFPLTIRSIGQVSILVEPVPSSASRNKLNKGWRVRDSGRACHTVSAINMVERVYLLNPYMTFFLWKVRLEAVWVVVNPTRKKTSVQSSRELRGKLSGLHAMIS